MAHSDFNSTRRVTGRRLRPGAALLLCAALLLVWPALAQDQAPALVRVGTVQEQTLQQRWDAVGRLREVRRAVVAAEQSGRVMEVHAEEGDAVTGGQTVLAQIDDVMMKLAVQTAAAQLAQAQASIAEAEARLAQSQRDLRYLQELHAASSARPKEVQDAQARVQEDSARLEAARAFAQAARAALDRSREELARRAVVAPFDGVVVRKMTEVGQWLAPGMPVAEIVSRGQIDAVIDVPERLINQVKLDQEVEIVIEPLAMEAAGKVVAINPMGSGAARTFPVKVRLADERAQLKPGMSVLARLPTGKEAQVLTVPRDAVHRGASGSVVWANIEGKAMPVGVQVLFGAGPRYAVRAAAADGPPLRPGVQVVIEGGERLFPTRPLQVSEQPVGPAPQAADRR